MCLFGTVWTDNEFGFRDEAKIEPRSLDFRFFLESQILYGEL